MIRFENRITIDRPVEDVFKFIANFENVPKWNYFVTDVQSLSDGPVGVGTTFHQIRIKDRQDYRITEYSPNREVAVETLPGSTPAFERRFTFEARNGNTQLTDTWSLDLGLNPLVQKLGKGRVKAAVAENLTKLKELLEKGRTRLQDGRAISI